jgi:hypothetical protein
MGCPDKFEIKKTGTAKKEITAQLSTEEKPISPAF